MCQTWQLLVTLASSLSVCVSPSPRLCCSWEQESDIAGYEDAIRRFRESRCACVLVGVHMRVYTCLYACVCVCVCV